MKSNSRQRMIDTFDFTHPDRIPVVYAPSQAGLHVHGQKLIDLFNEFPSDNPTDFSELPVPSGECDANGDYHETRTDEWGTTWEHRIFGIHGHPKKYPFNSWEEAADYSFPALPKIGSEEFEADQADLEAKKKYYFIIDGWNSIFERLHALQPMQDVLCDVMTQEDEFIAFLDRITDYRKQVIEYQIATGVDAIQFADDWGTQTSQMVSPALFKELFIPRYQELFKRAKDAGRRVFFHSCGLLGTIFDDLLELGIDGLWPQIKLYEDDPTFFEKCRDHQVAVYIHPDRQQLIPNGTPSEIDSKIKSYADLYRSMGGGGIFYVEIEDDAPFENVEALVKAIDHYR